MQPFVYIMETRDPRPLVKIGVSKNPRRRLKDLNTSRIVPFRYHSAIGGFVNQPAALETERLLHWVFREHRARGEMFNIDPRKATLAAAGLRLLMMPGPMRPFPVWLSEQAQNFPQQYELGLEDPLRI